MEDPREHRILCDWKIGAFRLLRCACGRHTLITGGAAISLDPRQLSDLSAVLGVARRVSTIPTSGHPAEAGWTDGTAGAMLSRLEAFRAPDLFSPGGCN